MPEAFPIYTGYFLVFIYLLEVFHASVFLENVHTIWPHFLLWLFQI